MKKYIKNFPICTKFQLLTLLTTVFLSSCVTSVNQEKQTPSYYVNQGDASARDGQIDEAIVLLEEETPNTYIERLNSYKANKPWRDKVNPKYQQTKIQFLSQCNTPSPSVYQQTIRDIKTIDQFDMIWFLIIILLMNFKGRHRLLINKMLVEYN